ncbi:MAG: sigma 54-interacting transcriptional regulator [Halopseudomonas sp.]|uniref:sigma-54 interaction domain-containing protein n=1 Tax=Halopseudomonas sp. TaxID=2901191 RepID=UPI00300235D3
MFDRVAQPLLYAESLLARFSTLAASSDSRALQQQLVAAAAELSHCPLAQLYLLDKTHTQLTLCAEWLDGAPLQREESSLPSDYKDQRLLQYCLFQNQVLHVNALDSSLYATPFLPETARSWRNLLCLPLHDREQQISGLLLIAQRETQPLEAFADSLRLLGDFAMGQLELLQQLDQQPEVPTPAVTSTIRHERGYGLVGESPAMQRVSRLISKVLHNPVSVIVAGETGTGKELVARAIHEYGLRRTRAFIAQNCSALPEPLLESELFGYVKGAFTGATQDRAGLFDAAHGGTLFLDEIGDMPLGLQAKLLRVLQEGELRPLGSNQTHKVDVRIIAASHHDLRTLVEKGQFREDLFYRLGHFPIEVPPLRERGGDIQLLAKRFAEDACCFLQRDLCRWSDEALVHLAAYHFPGNVRELKGLIARALLLCEGNVLLPEHFPLPDSPQPISCQSLRERLEQVERNLLLDCLRKNQGNQTTAASELGLPRRTLLYRMQRLNINAADLRQKERTHAQSRH